MPFVPIILVAMYLVYSAAAYPFGVLADRIDRHLQLAIGIAILIGADLVLAFADTIWMTVIGAALWGLHARRGRNCRCDVPASPTDRWLRDSP